MKQLLKTTFILFVIGINILLVSGCADNEPKYKRPPHAKINVNRNKTVSPVVVNQSVTSDNHSSRKAAINKRNNNSGEGGGTVGKLKSGQQPQPTSPNTTSAGTKSAKADSTLKTKRPNQNTGEDSGQ